MTRIEKACLVTVILLVGICIGFVIRDSQNAKHPFYKDDAHLPEDKWLKVPVRKWAAGSNGDGDIVGHLFIQTKVDSDRVNTHFIHQGDTCQYSGVIGWESLNRALNDKGPLFGLQIVK